MFFQANKPSHCSFLDIAIELIALRPDETREMLAWYCISEPTILPRAELWLALPRQVRISIFISFPLPSLCHSQCRCAQPKPYGSSLQGLSTLLTIIGLFISFWLSVLSTSYQQHLDTCSADHWVIYWLNVVFSRDFAFVRSDHVVVAGGQTLFGRARIWDFYWKGPSHCTYFISLWALWHPTSLSSTVIRVIATCGFSFRLCHDDFVQECSTCDGAYSTGQFSQPWCCRGSMGGWKEYQILGDQLVQSGQNCS